MDACFDFDFFGMGAPVFDEALVFAAPARREDAHGPDCADDAMYFGGAPSDFAANSAFSAPARATRAVHGTPGDSPPPSPLDRKSQPRYKPIAPASFFDSVPATNAPDAGLYAAEGFLSLDTPEGHGDTPHVRRARPHAPPTPRSAYAALQMTPAPAAVQPLSQSTRERIRQTVQQRLLLKMQRAAASPVAGGQAPPSPCAPAASPMPVFKAAPLACRNDGRDGFGDAGAVCSANGTPSSARVRDGATGFDEFFSADAFAQAAAPVCAQGAAGRRASAALAPPPPLPLGLECSLDIDAAVYSFMSY